MIEFTILQNGKRKVASLFRRFVIKLAVPKLNLAELNTRKVTVFKDTLFEPAVLQYAARK